MVVSLFDAVINCELAGSNSMPTLVFLHGNGEDLRVFDRQMDYFSMYYKTVAVDTRGHGLSTRGTAPLNFCTFANDLADVFEALNIDKAHIVGFSDGAATALHFALYHPKHVASLVLLGANYHPKGLLWIPRIQIILAYFGLSVASLFSKKIRKRQEIWGLMVSQPQLTLSELSCISVPTLIVTGENDMVSQRHNDEMHCAIVGSQRLIIPKGNHFWMFKQPETLNQCIMDFLNQCVYPEKSNS